MLTFCMLIFLFYSVSKCLQISIILNHFYYFLLGILFYSKFSLMESINSKAKDIIYTSAILFLVILFTFNQFYQPHYLGRSVMIGIVSSVTIFLITKRAGTNTFTKFFRWIGSFSLDVYVLHYFFLIGAHNLIDRNWFIDAHWLVQAFVLIFGATVLLMCSYLISKLIRSSKLLTKLTLGC